MVIHASPPDDEVSAPALDLAALGIGSGEFSSPRSSTGGVRSTVSMGQHSDPFGGTDVFMGSSVVFVVNAEGLCRACVGTGGIQKFCCKLVKDCDTRSHRDRERKMLSIIPGMYIKAGGGGGLAFAEPRLETASLPESLIREVLARDGNANKARDWFVAISGAIGFDSKIELDDLLEGAKAEAFVVQNYKTPARKREQGLKGSIFETEALGLDYDLDDDLGLGTIKEEAPKDDVEDGVNALVKEVRRLQALIGNQEGVEVLDTEVTLWDSIANILIKLAMFEGSLAGLLRKAEYGRLVEDMGTVLRRYNLRIQGVEETVNRLEAKLDRDRAASGSDLGLRGFGPVSFSGVGLSSDHTRSLEDMIRRVEALEELSKRKEDASVVTAIRLLNETFTSQEDVERWYFTWDEEGFDGIPEYGLFVDPLIFFQWTWRSMMGTSSMQNDMVQRSKLGMNEAQMMVFDSFQQSVPLCFTGEKKSVLSNNAGLDVSRFNNAKTYTDYNNPMNEIGLKQQMQKHGNFVRNSLEGEIKRMYNGKPYKLSMALFMLEVSHGITESLHQYLTESYMTFTTQSIGSSKEIWGLLTYVVEQLFTTEFAKCRQEALCVLNKHDRPTALKLIWCSMKSVALAKHLMTVGIKETAPVSASYTRYVLMQSNLGKLSTMEEETKNLKRKVDSQHEEIVQLKKLCAECKKQSDRALSRLGGGDGGGGRGGGDGGGGRGGGRS